MASGLDAASAQIEDRVFLIDELEGETTSPDEMSDLSPLEIIYPGATAFTLVPSGGKGNVINTVQRFREHLPEDVFRLRVRGLVDADQPESNTPQGIWVLPVCMIENFLLDPEALPEYGRSIGIVKFATSEAVLEELRLMREMRDEEIQRRVGRQIKAIFTLTMPYPRISNTSKKQITTEPDLH
jgi:hypothetical protein